MTWSYSGNPASSDMDAVRYLIGDTDSTDPLLLDAEVTWCISTTNNIYEAAVKACYSLVAKFTRLLSMSTDGMSVQYSQRAVQFKNLVSVLEAQYNDHLVALPYAGGTSISDMAAVVSDPDRPLSIMDPVEVVIR